MDSEEGGWEAAYWIRFNKSVVMPVEFWFSELSGISWQYRLYLWDDFISRSPSFITTRFHTVSTVVS
jgi:hypothetical protein